MSRRSLAPIFMESPDSADERGFSFSIPGALLGALSGIHDVHIASIEPGAVRGNHYHACKNEIISVSYESSCSFVWDEGEGSEVRRKDFAGAGSVAILVPPGGSHAVANTGDRPIFLVVMSDSPYDPEQPDAFKRVVFDVRA